MHKVSPLHPQVPSHGLKVLFSICNCLNLRTRNQGIQRADYILKKNPPINGPGQLKHMLFKDQLQLHHFQLPAVMYESSLSSTFFQQLGQSVFLIVSQSNRYRVESYCIFDLHSLKTNHVEQLFICLFANYIFFDVISVHIFSPSF